MKSRWNSAATVIGLCLGCCLIPSALSQDEGVFLDPATGNYVVRFKSYGGELAEGTFFTSTRIDPLVKSTLKHTATDAILYRYKVRNGKAGNQDLNTIIIQASNAETSGQYAPTGWDNRKYPAVRGEGYLVSWSYLIGVARREGRSAEGIPPGSSQKFGFQSKDLPSVGIMQLIGSAPITELPDEGPDPESPVGKAYNELRRNDFVPRFAAIPKIPNPTPFNAVTVLTGLQQHVKDDLVGMKLVEPGFALKLDQGLVAAIEAGKRGNTEGLRSELKKLRQLLKGLGEPEEEEHTARKDRDEDNESWPPEDQINTKAWPHPIAKLAARVLEFDLRYVERRVKGALE